MKEKLRSRNQTQIWKTTNNRIDMPQTYSVGKSRNANSVSKRSSMDKDELFKRLH